jgi:hypothetical protein
MAFANPLVISVNAVNKSLQKINQDSYGSEYFLREATQSFRAKIRHSRDNSSTGTGRIHRANVVITQTVFSVTPGVPDNVREVSLTLRSGDADSATDNGYLGAALSGLMVAARYEDLVGWLN